MSPRSFPVRALHAWYIREKRVLPWRNCPTPYRVWVSEIMLQQTQVKNVIPYYDRFLKRFPTLKSLAQGPESEVLRFWSGLGYYSRARNLHKAARLVLAGLKGHLPDNPEELVRLPGIGPYTAGAIASLAFGKPVPLLDGNVYRVLSRFFLESSWQKCWEYSSQAVRDAYVARIPPSDFNQALMELGALVCEPKNPQCSICPVFENCQALCKKLQSSYPPRRKHQKITKLIFVLLLAEKGGRLLVRRRSKNARRFKNMWEFPMVQIDPASKRKPKTADLARSLGKELASPVTVNKILGKFGHSITRNKLEIWVVNGTLAGAVRNARWVSRSDLKDYSGSSMMQKAVKLICAP